MISREYRNEDYMNKKLKKENAVFEALCSLYRFNNRNDKLTSVDIQNAIGVLEFILNEKQTRQLNLFKIRLQNNK